MIDQFKGDYRWLSNFWMEPLCLISAFGMLASTVEHAYQAAKCELESERYTILNCESPGAAKRMGRHVQLRADWEYMKKIVMYTLLRRKFATRNLRQKLLETGDTLLVEGNRWGDRYWGAEKVSTAKLKETPRYEVWPPESKLEEHDELWCGSNNLGMLLMDVRNDLKLLRGL